jgi:hypothetical protein
LLLAEATRRIPVVATVSAGLVATVPVAPLVVPLSSRGTEMAATAMPLFGDVNLGFAAAADRHRPGEQGSWRPYLPEVTPGGVAILVDDYVDATALERIEVSVKTLSDLGASEVRLACLRVTEDLVDAIEERDFTIEIITFAIEPRQ